MQTAKQLEWNDLCGKLAADCAVGMALCGWLAGWYLLNVPGAGLILVLTAMALIGVGGWLWTRAAHRPQQTAALLTAAAFASVAAVWYSLRLPELAYVFAVPIMLAALMLRTWVAALVGAGVWLVVYGPLAPPVAVHGSVSALLLLLSAFQVTVMRSVRNHLKQTQSYQAHVVDVVERARLHQTEVKRLNKSLALAYTLLHRKTQEIAAARQSAENALRLKEQFAIYASHELRTPLNIILGFLEVLQRYPEVYGEVRWTPMLRRDIAEIQRSARHLLDLVDDLLDLARIDAVKMPVHRESCQLEDVLAEAVDLERRLLVQKPVALRLSIDGQLPSLYIDRTRIRQVVLNLLANAGRFTPTGEIHVYATRRAEDLLVTVRDTGVGIASEHLATLFDDYAQTPQSGRAGGGKGLGLAIAKRFVQMHGGRIWAESEIGRGSVFFFTIPVETVQVASAIRHTVVPELTDHQYHVVVIDPEPAAAAYLRRQLDEVQITPAVDLEQARQIARDHHPDALLLNVAPDRNVAACGTPPPILVEGAPLIQCTLPVGGWLLDRDCFDHWLVKPVESARLLQTMDRYCPAGGKVLLADDDRSFVQLVHRVLQAAARPYTLSWAYTLDEGLTKAQEDPPDLLLMDIALAGSDGRVLAQWMRRHELHHAVPVVAISSYAPGAEGEPLRSCSFALTRGEGFSESETLELIIETLHRIRPRYAASSLDAVPL